MQPGQMVWRSRSWRVKSELQWPQAEAAAIVVDWAETTVTTIGGASHLVLGRYEAATDLVLDFLSDAP